MFNLPPALFDEQKAKEKGKKPAKRSRLQQPLLRPIA